MTPSCDDCVKHGTIYCPISVYCYSTDDKPYFVKKQKPPGGIIQKFLLKRRAFLSMYGFYRIEDLKIGGNCGICGKQISVIMPKEWPWGLCDKCIERSR